MDVFFNNQDEYVRVVKLKRISRKLARNKNRTRVVRKLPQTIFVEPARPRRRAPRLRRSINENKRLVYLLLLGAVLTAYVYEMEGPAWQSVYDSLFSPKTAPLPLTR